MSSNEDLAKAALKSMVKMQLIKWGIIIAVTRSLRRAAEKAAKS